MLTEIRQAIERFLETSQDPVLCEPGEESLAIGPENFVLEVRGACAQLQAWDHKRNLVRRVSAIERKSRGKLVLRVARFGKLAGTLELIDRRRALAKTMFRSAPRASDSASNFASFCAASFPVTS